MQHTGPSLPLGNHHPVMSEFVDVLFDSDDEALDGLQRAESAPRTRIAASFSNFSDGGEEWSNHSPENRNPVSPIMPESTAGTKRRDREVLTEPADEDEESPWNCTICTKLAEDAVQTPCCGMLHCRSCIKQWLATPSSRSQCAFCRSSVSPWSLIKDVRAERESAAAMRKCNYAEHGCKAKGSRKEMLEHQRSCHFVPVGILRRRIEELEHREFNKQVDFENLKQQLEVSRTRLRLNDAEVESLKANRSQDREMMMRMSDAIEDLSRKSQIHLNYANALLNCCLRDNSGKEAMKVLHKVRCVYQVARGHLREWFSTVLTFCLTDVYLKESNYNVSAVFKRKPGITYCPTEDLTVALLHPWDPKWKVTIRVTKERWRALRCCDCITVENVMTSDEFDKFCIEGKFFLSCSEHEAGSQSSTLVCHCGVELSNRRHICRADASTPCHCELSK